MHRFAMIAIASLAVASSISARAEILIGAAAPLTGTNAWTGQQIIHGAETAVSDINAAGGVLGQRLRLIAADDFCDPEQAVAAAQKLVGDGVTFGEYRLVEK